MSDQRPAAKRTPAEHPPGNLSLAYSRRTFWRGVLHEAFVVSGLLKGGQECRLSELDTLADECLAQVRPVVHPSCEIFQDGDQIWSRCKTTGAVVRLFPVGQTANQVALGMFDGHHTLGEVGVRLAQAMDWDEATGFSQAKDLFLSLSDRLICIPRDPLEPLE